MSHLALQPRYNAAMNGTVISLRALTPDYTEGRRAREELETAITKQIKEDIRVMPTIYEPCDRPDFLKPLHYVDGTHHADGQFD